MQGFASLFGVGLVLGWLFLGWSGWLGFAGFVVAGICGALLELEVIDRWAEGAYLGLSCEGYDPKTRPVRLRFRGPRLAPATVELARSAGAPAEAPSAPPTWRPSLRCPRG